MFLLERGARGHGSGKGRKIRREGREEGEQKGYFVETKLYILNK